MEVEGEHGFSLTLGQLAGVGAAGGRKMAGGEGWAVGWGGAEAAGCMRACAQCVGGWGMGGGHTPTRQAAAAG